MVYSFLSLLKHATQQIEDLLFAFIRSATYNLIVFSLVQKRSILKFNFDCYGSIHDLQDSCDPSPSWPQMTTCLHNLWCLSLRPNSHLWFLIIVTTKSCFVCHHHHYKSYWVGNHQHHHHHHHPDNDLHHSASHVPSYGIKYDCDVELLHQHL